MWQSSDIGATGGRVMDNEPRSAHSRVQTMSQVKQSSVSEADLAEFRKSRPCGRFQTSKSIEAEFRQRGCWAEFRQKFLLFFLVLNVHTVSLSLHLSICIFQTLSVHTLCTT
jgi:hypothetical protein